MDHLSPGVVAALYTLAEMDITSDCNLSIALAGQLGGTGGGIFAGLQGEIPLGLQSAWTGVNGIVIIPINVSSANVTGRKVTARGLPFRLLPSAFTTEEADLPQGLTISATAIQVPRALLKMIR